MEIKKAVPREEQQNIPRSNKSSVSNITRTKKIFVGGLATSVTEEDFRNYFSQFGNITDVVVMYDPATQRPRGFGFITFDSEDAVEKVIQQNTFHQIHEKLVEVKKAIPKEVAGTRMVLAAGYGGVRAMAYNNSYMQGSIMNNANAYVGPRFAPAQGGRGGYPSYSAPAYRPIGYGGNPGYGLAMNGAYGTNVYGGGGGYSKTRGFGRGRYGSGYSATLPTGPAGGYAGAPQVVGPRSPWGHSNSGYGPPGSPAGGYGGYGGPGWNSGPATQSNGGSSGYYNGGYGYGSSDEVGHDLNTRGFPPRHMANGMDSYSTAHYGGATSPWKNGVNHVFPASGSGGYGNGMGAYLPGPMGYGVIGREIQCGPHAQFRPYLSTADQRTS